MKLSIIVPLFKVEDYLAICLTSLLHQDLSEDDYEIIVINDGSPDNSENIARDFASRHTNITVISQENQGVSVARNRGLDVAKGKYIVFVDPDDSLYPGCLPAILDRADAENLDILYLSLHAFDHDGNFLLTAEKSGDDGVVLDGFSHPRRTYLSTLYRKDVIGDIRFKRGIIRGQDTVFNMMVQTMAKRCSYCSLPYYKYLQRETSSRQFVGTERNFISSLLAIDTIREFQKEHFPSPTQQQTDYFENAILIFIQRILEWNILPQSNKKNFDALKAHLQKIGLGHLITPTARKFPHFEKSFLVFMSYRRLKRIYNIITGKTKK